VRVQCIGARYQVLEEALGKGGSAVVHRALDTASATEVALKQLVVDEHSAEHAEAVALFEREYLAQGLRPVARRRHGAGALAFAQARAPRRQRGQRALRAQWCGQADRLRHDDPDGRLGRSRLLDRCVLGRSDGHAPLQMAELYLRAARTALAAGEEELFADYARACASIAKTSGAPALVARYEALMEAAQGAHLQLSDEFIAFGSDVTQRLGAKRRRARSL
jgi:hypothetical protein